jgi:hypothetical protein
MVMDCTSPFRVPVDSFCSALRLLYRSRVTNSRRFPSPSVRRHRFSTMRLGSGDRHAFGAAAPPGKFVSRPVTAGRPAHRCSGEAELNGRERGSRHGSVAPLILYPNLNAKRQSKLGYVQDAGRNEQLR